MKDVKNSKPENKKEEKPNKILEKNGIKINGVSRAFSTFLILWMLSKEQMHGYLIMKKIDEFFEPQIKCGLMKETKANKIYPLLQSMKENKIIESFKGIHNKKEVKIYRLTDDGKKLLDVIIEVNRKNFNLDFCKELINDFNIEITYKEK